MKCGTDLMMLKPLRKCRFGYHDDIWDINTQITKHFPPQYWTHTSVLIISSHVHHDIPHSAEYPHGTQDNLHSTYDIPHSTDHLHRHPPPKVLNTYNAWCILVQNTSIKTTNWKLKWEIVKISIGSCEPWKFNWETSKVSKRHQTGEHNS